MLTLNPLPTFHLLPPPLADLPIDALYVHVPFCNTKCHYCDFYSLAGHLDRADAFLEALRQEILLHTRFWRKIRPSTVFIGGGTPTLLPPHGLATLLELLRHHFDLSNLTEFTVEANPNTFDPEKARILAQGGVNRVSFGAQSFNKSELEILQRDHEPASVPRAFDFARNAGINNLNLDLIFGIPGQTVSSWDYSLHNALNLTPDHMSCYSLIYEPNTAMTARMHKGDFEKIDEDLELALFEHVYDRLAAAGFTRYETSNYARPGRACRHNLAYWKAHNWLGLGPSAGSHVAHSVPPGDVGIPPAFRTEPAAWQWKNTGSLAHYLEALSSADATSIPITQLETLSRQKWAASAALFWLRLSEGLIYTDFHQRTGTNPRRALEETLTPFAAQGFVELLPDRARITQSGVAVSDHILKRVLPALESPKGALQ